MDASINLSIFQKVSEYVFNGYMWINRSHKTF